jgi:hypothetical protein
MSRIGKKRFQGDEAAAKTETDAKAHAGLVRTAKNPGVASRQGVSPKGAFTDIQCNVWRTDRHYGALRVHHGVDSLETPSKFRGINQRFGPPALESSLCLRHAVLDRLDFIAARERAPGSHPEALEDDVGIDQDWTFVTGHGFSKLYRGRCPIDLEEITQFIDREIE